MKEYGNAFEGSFDVANAQTGMTTLTPPSSHLLIANAPKKSKKVTSKSYPRHRPWRPIGL
jgi:hypothetical protein